MAGEQFGGREPRLWGRVGLGRGVAEVDPDRVRLAPAGLAGPAAIGHPPAPCAQPLAKFADLRRGAKAHDYCQHADTAHGTAHGTTWGSHRMQRPCNGPNSSAGPAPPAPFGRRTWLAAALAPRALHCTVLYGTARHCAHAPRGARGGSTARLAPHLSDQTCCTPVRLPSPVSLEVSPCAMAPQLRARCAVHTGGAAVSFPPATADVTRPVQTRPAGPPRRQGVT